MIYPRFEFTPAGIQVTDEPKNPGGGSAYSLIHDTLFGGADLVIRTAAGGGGTLLIENTDYTVGDIDVTLKGSGDQAVYRTITVINVAYQNTLLYHTYKTVGDYNKAADINDLQNQAILNLTSALPQRTSVRPSSIITTFQTGHGWSGSSGWAAETTDGAYLLGKQCIKCVPTSGATRSYSKSSLTLDSTGKYAKLLIKVDDSSLIANNGIQFQLLNDASNYWWWVLQAIDIGMFTPNDWVEVTLSFQDGEKVGNPTRNNITQAKLLVGTVTGKYYTTWVNEVSLVAEPSTGYVSITFDDLSDSQFTLAKPIMDAYRFSGTVYAVVDYVDKAGYMSLANLKTLESIGWGVGGHSFTQVSHAYENGFLDITAEQMEYELFNTKQWLINNGFRNGIHDFAYPHGRISHDIIANTKKYFYSGRGTHGGLVVHETMPTYEPYRLRGVSSISSAAGGITAAQVQSMITNAATYKTWLILVFHQLVTSPDTPADTTQILDTEFASIMSTINSTAGVKCMPIHEVMKLM